MSQRLELIVEVDGKRQVLKDLDEIRKAISLIDEGMGESSDGASSLFESVSQLAFGFNNVLQSAQTLFAQVGQGYDLLIGQNERFNQGVLQSAASLAANADVFRDGIKIDDAGEAIRALNEPITASIREVEKATRSLVGVTEAETTQIFNTILSQSAKLANQSKEFPDSIKAAEQLAPGLVATLGTLQIPLEQASLEIRDLLQGSITDDTAIAKALQISNEDVRRAREAGTVVDYLRSKFEPFTVANAMAAKSVDGITSNIRGLIETSARAAGLPLYDQLVDQLARLEQFLIANEDALQSFATAAVGGVTEAIAPIGDVLIDELIPALGEFIAALADSAGGLDSLASLAGEGIASGIKFLAMVLKGAADNADLLRIAATLLAAQFAAMKLAALIQAVGALGAAFVGFTGANIAASAALGSTNAGLLALAGGSTAATGGMAALSAGAAALGGTLMAALPPLIAIGAAIAAIKFAQVASDLKKANEEIAQSTLDSGLAQDAALNAAQRTANAIDRINEAKEKGIALTKEEINQYKRLAQANQLRIDDAKAKLKKLEAQRAALEGKRGFFGIGDDAIDSQRNTLDAEIASTTNTIETIEDQNAELSAAVGVDLSGSVTTAEPALKNLGSVAEQMGDKIQSSFERATGGIGNLSENSEKASEAIGLINQAVEQGSLSTGEAIRMLQELADEDTILYEQRIEAQETLTQIQEQANEERLNNNLTAQSEVERAIAEGRIRDADGEAQLTALKAQELEQRLADVQAFLAAEAAAGRGDGARAKELLSQERDLQIQLAEARSNAARSQREAAISELERQLTEASNLIQDAEQERLLSTQQLLNDGLISERQASAQRVSITRDRLTAELNIERQRLEELRALPLPNDPEEREAAEQQIRESLRQTTALQLNLLENEREMQQIVAQEAQRQLDLRLYKVERNAENQLRQLQAANDAIDRQNQLLTKQGQLADALANVESTEGQIKIDELNEELSLRQRLSEEEDAGVRRVIERRLRQLGIRGDEESIIKRIAEQERELARNQIEQFERQAELRREQLAIEIKMQQIANERLLIESQLQQSQARIAIASAQLIVDPEEREIALREANLQLESATLATNAAQAQIEAQSELSELSQKILEAELEVEEAQTRAAAESAIFAANLKEAESSAQNIADSIGGGRELNAFKDGGVAKPGLALVGEAGPEIVKIGSTSRVFSNAESMAIAQKALASTGLGKSAIMGFSQDRLLLSEVERLHQTMQSLQSGTIIGSLSMPQTYQLDRDHGAIAAVVSQTIREALSASQGNRRPNYRG